MSNQIIQEMQGETQSELGAAADTPHATPTPQSRPASRPGSRRNQGSPVRADSMLPPPPPPTPPTGFVSQYGGGESSGIPPMPQWSVPANNDDEQWERFEQQCEWAIQHNVTRACVSVEVPKPNGERGYAAYKNFDVPEFDPMDLPPGTYRIRFRGSRQQWGTTVAFTRAELPGDTTPSPQQPTPPTTRVHTGLAVAANPGMAGLAGDAEPMNMTALLMYMMKQSDARAEESARRSHEFMLKMIELGKPSQPGGTVADQLALIKVIADMSPKSDPTSIINIAKELASDMIGDGPSQPDKPRVPRRDPLERILSSLAPLAEKTVDAIVASGKKNEVKHVPNVAAVAQPQAQSLAGAGGHPAPALSSVGDKLADAGAPTTGDAAPPASPVAPGEPASDPTDEQVAQSIVVSFLDIMQHKAPWPESRDLRIAGALAAAFDAEVPDDQTEKRITDVQTWIEANVTTLGGECANRGIPPTRAIAALNAAKHLILGRDDDAGDSQDDDTEGGDE